MCGVVCFACGTCQNTLIWLPRGQFFLTRIFLSFSKMYIQVKLHHCAFYQFNHCYINSYLDEDSAPNIVLTIKGLNRDVGLHGKS